MKVRRTGTGGGRREARALVRRATMAIAKGSQPLGAPIEEMGRAALELAEMRVALGVDEADEEREGELLLRIDGRVQLRAHLLGSLLPGAEEVSAGAGVRAEDVSRLLDQHLEMGEVAGGTQVLLGGIRDSRRVLGRTLRKLMGRLMRASAARLAALPPESPERAELLSDLMELRAQEAAYRELLAARGAETRAEAADADAEREAEARREELERVLAALSGGQRVPAVEREAAAATLAALRAEEAAAERRERSR